MVQRSRRKGPDSAVDPRYSWGLVGVEDGRQHGTVAMSVHVVRHCRVGGVEGIFYGVGVDWQAGAVVNVKQGLSAGDVGDIALGTGLQEAVSEAERGCSGG